MKNKNFRPDIEGLRGIAILLVVAYHINLPGFSGGFIGVDVFFVLSGYLITGLLVKEMQQTGGIDFAGFYSRRIRRLLPASALALLVTVVVSFLILSPIEQNRLWRSALATSVYISNFHFAEKATLYLAGSDETNPFLHTWSLSVEEQFYIVFPLLVFLALRQQNNKNRLIFVLTLVGAASFTLCLFLTSRNQPYAFFSSPTRAWEFAAGGLASLFLITNVRLERLAGCIGLGLIIGSAIVFNSNTVFPGAAALIPVFGTIFILRSGQTDRAAYKLLSADWLQFFGRISYSWYLWHWSILVLGAEPENKTVFSTAVRLGISLLLAILSYYFIENPIRRNSRFALRPVYTIFAAALFTMAAVGGIYTWRFTISNIVRSPKQQRIIEAMGDYTPGFYQNCMSDFTETDLKECSFGAEDSQTIVVLFGDSHAAMWYPALKTIAENERWRLITHVKSGCSPIDVNYFYPKIGRRYTECEQWRIKAFSRIDQLNPNLIIVSGSQIYQMLEGNTDSEWVSGTKRTFERLGKNSRLLLYIRDVPRPGFDVAYCLSSADSYLHKLSPPNCTFERKIALKQKIYNTEQQAIKESSVPVSYLDLTEEICPGEICQPESEGNIIYRDTNHITATFIQSLSPVLRQAIVEESNNVR